MIPKDIAVGTARRPFPFALLASLLALVCVGWGLVSLVGAEKPVGKIEGRILLDELKQPIKGVSVVIVPDYPTFMGYGPRHATTDADGRFRFSRVSSGGYHLSASSSAHSASDSALTVEEGKTTYLNLNLKRNSPDLEVMQHQKMFGTYEHAAISIRGYLDPKKVLAVPRQRDAVHIRIYATRLSELLQDNRAGRELTQLGYSNDRASKLPDVLLHPTRIAAPRLVLDRDLFIDTADKEGFYYQKIDLARAGAPARPGVYLIDLEHAGKTACTWLLVTDTALVLKRAGHQLVSYVVDMRTGDPLPDCEVRSYQKGNVIAHGRTGKEGVAQLTLPSLPEDHSDNTRAVTVAFRGKDEAVVQREVHDEDREGDYTVYTYTDRTVYRPGQHIAFKGIVRKNRAYEGLLRGTQLADAPDDDPARRYSVPAGVPVTVDVRDKGGERLLHQALVTNRYGSFSGQLDLLKEAETGVYTLVTKIGGKEHTSDIYVASYKKPEFTVTVTPEKRYAIRGEPIKATIEGKYYFGTPVAGAKVRYMVYSTPDWRAAYADSDTDTPDDTESGDNWGMNGYRADGYFGGFVEDGEVTLDENGRAIVTINEGAKETDSSSRSKRSRRHRSAPEPTDPADQERGPQEMIYTITASVTASENRMVEANGETHVVRGAFRLTVSPEGYVAEPGKPTQVSVIARDYNGQPVANQKLTLETGYESWKDEGYKYVRGQTLQATTDSFGHAVIGVVPAHNGTFRLKARSYDANQHLVLGTAVLWVSGDRGGDLDTTYDDLSLFTDKRTYRPGDTARVLINTANVGSTALLTVEGSSVQHVQTVHLTSHSTVIRVPILAGYGPNIFLDACYVKNKHFARSEAPLRVSIPKTELTVHIRADREPATPAQPATLSAKPGSTPPPLARYAPGDHITYTVETLDMKGKGVPAEFSFGVVDEAIYALRADDPNAFRQAFYPKRYNAVGTEYSFQAYYLGDADKSEPKIETRKRFPDTAYWVPMLQTDASGKATVSFMLPDNLTTWRATATAQTLDTRIGRATDKVMVNKEFMVRLETPRTLTQHDHTQLLGIVHNETDVPQTALVRLRAENLTLEETTPRTIDVPAHGSAQLVWHAVANGYGDAKLTVTAWTPKAAGRPQYTDGLEARLSIRPHGVERISTAAGELTATRPSESSFEIDSKAIPGLSTMLVRVTPSVASALTGGLEYLIGYPYGCVEQTLSRVMPDLLVQRTLKMRALTPTADDLSKTRDLNKMVREGLQRLYRFQHQSGAWGWWEHDGDDPWMTGYVLVGLATARTEGYPVSARVLARGREAGVNMLKTSKPGDLPFLMYGLAMVGERKAVASARRLLPLPGLTSENLAYVDRIDTLLGKNDGAAYALLSKRAIEQDGMLYWKSGADYRQSDVTTTAMAWRAMLAHDPNDARILPTLRWLMSRRTDGYWSDTRDTALVLTAFTEYLRLRPGYSSGGRVQVELNGKIWNSLTLSQDNLAEREIVLRVPSELLTSGTNRVKMTRLEGNSPIFYTLETRQTVPSEVHPSVLASAAKNTKLASKLPDVLVVERDYRRIKKNPSANTPWLVESEAITGTNHSMKPGEQIRVHLTIYAPRDMSYVLIEDAFPAGCEPNERGDVDENEWSDWWSSVNVRDDRIAFFARTLTKGMHHIEYNLRPQTSGTYHALPAMVQAMYSPQEKAYSSETTVEVKP